MNCNPGGNRRLRRAAALALAASVAVLAAACGSTAPSSATATTYAQVLALARCMRSHGVPDFPDPDTSGGYSLASNGSLRGAGGSSIDINSSQVQTAYGHCQHLIPGGPSFSQLEQKMQQAQQQRDKMLPLLLRYTQCMRSHGVPGFPAPGQSPQQVPPIDVHSPQYLAATAACRPLLPPGAQVSISRSTPARQSGS